jgi:hypothetical protein
MEDHLVPAQSHRLLVKVDNVDICGATGRHVGVLGVHGVLQPGSRGAALLVVCEHLKPEQELECMVNVSSSSSPDL